MFLNGGELQRPFGGMKRLSLWTRLGPWSCVWVQLGSTFCASALLLRGITGHCVDMSDSPSGGHPWGEGAYAETSPFRCAREPGFPCLHL